MLRGPTDLKRALPVVRQKRLQDMRDGIGRTAAYVRGELEGRHGRTATESASVDQGSGRRDTYECGTMPPAPSHVIVRGEKSFAVAIRLSLPDVDLVERASCVGLTYRLIAEASIMASTARPSCWISCSSCVKPDDEPSCLPRYDFHFPAVTHARL